MCDSMTVQQCEGVGWRQGLKIENLSHRCTACGEYSIIIAEQKNSIKKTFITYC